MKSINAIIITKSKRNAKILSPMLANVKFISTFCEVLIAI